MVRLPLTEKVLRLSAESHPVFSAGEKDHVSFWTWKKTRISIADYAAIVLGALKNVGPS